MAAHALTIAGSDPSGGAGIQADLKTFHAFGVYGMAVLTSLTAQNTRGVTGIHDVVAQGLKCFYQLSLAHIPHLDDQPSLASYLATEGANTLYAATQVENGRG